MKVLYVFTQIDGWIFQPVFFELSVFFSFHIPVSGIGPMQGAMGDQISDRQNAFGVDQCQYLGRELSFLVVNIGIDQSVMADQFFQ